MSHRNEIVELPRTVIVGVDTHKHIHVAVALDALGARLATCSASADRAGYMELVAWAHALGIVEAFGIERTGSYGVGPRELCAPTRHPRGRGQPSRPAKTTQQRQERYDRRRDRRPLGAVGDRDSHPEDHRRRRRDGALDQDRPRYRRKSPQCRHHHAQVADRQRL